MESMNTMTTRGLVVVVFSLLASCAELEEEYAVCDCEMRPGSDYDSAPATQLPTDPFEEPAMVFAEPLDHVAEPVDLAGEPVDGRTAARERIPPRSLTRPQAGMQRQSTQPRCHFPFGSSCSSQRLTPSTVH